jgi:hypothetical protein
MRRSRIISSYVGCFSCPVGGLEGEGEVLSFSTVWLKMARGDEFEFEEDDEEVDEAEVEADVMDSRRETSRGCKTSLSAISA